MCALLLVGSIMNVVDVREGNVHVLTVRMVHVLLKLIIHYVSSTSAQKNEKPHRFLRQHIASAICLDKFWITLEILAFTFE